MTKAAFLDVDGTLTNDQNAWEKVHRRFGLADQMKEHIEQFFAKKITYEEWANIDVKMWKGRSYAEFQSALKDPILIKHAVEGTELLKNHGYEIILVSGGLEEMVKNVAKEIDADYYISNLIGYNNGKINGTVDMRVGVSKKAIVEKIAKQRSINLSKSIAIGDGFNDIAMFKLVGFAIALNPKSDDVAENANAVYFSQDFHQVVMSFLEIL